MGTWRPYRVPTGTLRGGAILAGGERGARQGPPPVGAAPVGDSTHNTRGATGARRAALADPDIEPADRADAERHLREAERRAAAPGWVVGTDGVLILPGAAPLLGPVVLNDPPGGGARE